MPCLATLSPAPEATKAAVVEILKVFRPSPPVPTMSNNGPDDFTGMALARITEAIPAISSGDSPLMLSAVKKAPICEEVACPFIISSMT